MSEQGQSDSDIHCAVCGDATRVPGYGQQHGTLQALWGYGSQHDGERYRVYLCESCFFGTLAYALPDSDSKHLVTSCQALVEIYAKRDQQHLLAGLTTSTSAALRAGYCRGVLDEFRRRTDFCYQGDWYVQASRIADYPEYAEQLPAVDELLKQSCAI